MSKPRRPLKDELDDLIVYLRGETLPSLNKIRTMTLTFHALYKLDGAGRIRPGNPIRRQIAEIDGIIRADPEASAMLNSLVQREWWDAFAQANQEVLDSDHGHR